MMNAIIPTRPYKLSPRKGKITNSDLLKWDLSFKNFCRRNNGFGRFITGGTISTWTATRKDNSNGLLVTRTETVNKEKARYIDEERTQELRDNFLGFLTTLAMNSPDEMMETIIQE